MLKPAQLYKEELRTQYIQSWQDLENMWWNSSPIYSELDIEDNTESHKFVSVDDGNRVIGYIGYSIDWEVMRAYNFEMLSFDKGNLLFIKDLFQAVCDVFKKFNCYSLMFECFADNPVLKSYRNFIRRHGGRECGYYTQCTKLPDGKIHDIVQFEIMREDFRKYAPISRTPKEVFEDEIDYMYIGLPVKDDLISRKELVMKISRYGTGYAGNTKMFMSTVLREILDAEGRYMI